MPVPEGEVDQVVLVRTDGDAAVTILAPVAECEIARAAEPPVEHGTRGLRFVRSSIHAFQLPIFVSPENQRAQRRTHTPASSESRPPGPLTELLVSGIALAGEPSRHTEGRARPLVREPHVAVPGLCRCVRYDHPIGALRCSETLLAETVRGVAVKDSPTGIQPQRRA